VACSQPLWSYGLCYLGSVDRLSTWIIAGTDACLLLSSFTAFAKRRSTLKTTHVTDLVLLASASPAKNTADLSGGLLRRRLPNRL
jgi:hypothetical protein